MACYALGLINKNKSVVHAQSHSRAFAGPEETIRDQNDFDVRGLMADEVDVQIMAEAWNGPSQSHGTSSPDGR